MPASFVPRTATLDAAIEKFHNAFVNMLVGKTDGAKFVNKSDMFVVLKAAHEVNNELARCDVETPTYDPLLAELKNMMPLYEHPSGNVPFQERLDLPPTTDLELITGGMTKPKDSTAKTATTKPVTAKTTTANPPATTKPATKPDVATKRTTATAAKSTNAAGAKVTNAAGGKKVNAAGVKSIPMIEARNVVRKAVTYLSVDEDESSGEEKQEEEEESGQEEEEEEEAEVVSARPTRRRVVKSAAVITDEMEEDEGITWSLADRRQAERDAAWSGPDPKDPCSNNDTKDIRYWQFYWGPYSTPLAKPSPISREDLPNRRLNPIDKEGLGKYVLADVYDTPCIQCAGGKNTPAKPCVMVGCKPVPLATTEAEEEKERAAACASCRHHKRRCEGRSRGRSRQIVLNPFNKFNQPVKGNGKAKVKTEKVTPAAKTRAARCPAVDDVLPEADETEAVTSAGKTGRSRRPAVEEDLPNGKLETRMAAMEKTCQGLAKKIGDLDTTMRRLLKNSSEKLTLDIHKLEQAHKSTKAYVEQKTCTAMEALEELGNAVHQTLENMVNILDEVPEEVRDALQELGESAAGDDTESALHDIRATQARWADLANLVEMLIPKSMGGNAVASASHTPTPPQHAPLLPSAIVPQHTVDANPAATIADITPAATIADAAPSESPMPNDEKVDIEMTEAEPVDDNEEHASGEPEDEPTPMQQDDSEIGLNKERLVATTYIMYS
ncbi:uncharacterized protein LACBIDRAFT_327559 [Laccaria bicolor S238N-H82]|uniref:Predicted protein n=1 Tax=Laccaria bicolor (strain S238N-H82 / ATCC MYA-4686) TaxID=486041 RepID=B0DC43_LACBS|nr:uncharacterized protein LACBIDRAFT_327559 [Laccaria bicolor S238N-H82]EDR07826.1 predicted protein [Laccaria bicolor S238N-H82]|eukprot:XP_001881615.1 predicted protein [Laccaria bicolor S238N-H82]